MTIEKFKSECDKIDGCEYIHRGGHIIVECKGYWSMFPDDRIDKMEKYLNNIKLTQDVS